MWADVNTLSDNTPLEVGLGLSVSDNGYVIELSPSELFLLLTHVAGVSQEALGVCYQLWVPPVGAVSEAGQLPASRGRQRLCGGLRGELRSWPRVPRSEEVLLQRLWPHLPDPQRPLQRWAEPTPRKLTTFLLILLQWSVVTVLGSCVP